MYCIRLLLSYSTNSTSCNELCVIVAGLSCNVFPAVLNFLFSPLNSTFAIWSMPTWSTKVLHNFSLKNGVNSSCIGSLSSWSLWKDANICLDDPIVVHLLSGGGLVSSAFKNKTKRAKCHCAHYLNSTVTFHCLLECDLVFKLNPGPGNSKLSVVSTHRRKRQSPSY